MAKIVITATTPCAPDHVNTRSYEEGEEYEIGSDLMPQWLADNLVLHGMARRVGKFAEVQEAVAKVIDKSEEKPVAKQPGPSELKKASK